MALIEPNTIVSYIYGAHFFNTAHTNSDYDIISVQYQSLIDVMKGISYKPKQKHGTAWLGSVVDLTRYDITHFLSLIAKGNISMIEIALQSDDSELVYKSMMYDKIKPKIEHLARLSLSHTNWGHIKGWMKQTMEKVERQGMNVKRAILMYRMIIEARTYINKQVFVCKWPDLIIHAKRSERELLQELYTARTTDKIISSSNLLKVEKIIGDGVTEVLELFDKYVPTKTHDLIKERQNVLLDVRMHQSSRTGLL